jgi:3-hydroxyisobutyrate dehydrogenase-like beta-hydroxyacid dehydrogenase
MKIGFIGLGNMGRAMASRLLAAHHEVHVWNRSPGPVQEMVDRGAQPLANPELAFEADAVISMLADDDAVRDVLLRNRIFERGSRGVIHVSMSTISVALGRELERAHADAGVAFIIATVLGRPDVAAAGKVHVLAAGEPSAIECVQSLLDAMAQTTWRVGTQPHQANAAKLAMNLLLASAIEAMAEATTLVERHGVEPAKLIEAATGTLFSAPAYSTYGDVIVTGKFEPALFRLPLGLKDLRLALEAGEGAGVPLPFASTVHDNLVDAIGHGDGNKDWSVMATVARRRAGLPERHAHAA